MVSVDNPTKAASDSCVGWIVAMKFKLHGKLFHGRVTMRSVRDGETKEVYKVLWSDGVETRHTRAMIERSIAVRRPSPRISVPITRTRPP